ncbi:tRNA pseudouridine(38-40) synthase TruA [Polynucleobacter antarcticus]|uniref:tRNA pseudouridine synthase A n=1 Tax=Polynucleobacter antarcticus TaxID=1743162 RepID=A0A6M9PRJ7_9BURK|nr:tRNA pseudouridine(38-40) synthase TruA [Polynucleobacter antarcticus]QKM62512.1 tRNA pseudouridine(38-40) synthase TruA [Polynucleobacter antarcticus]
MRIALGLQYDGSPYSGWQSQVQQDTVQDRLEKAINAFVGGQGSSPPIRVITAGRTDTGVHALGQVVHFDVDVDRDNWSWVRGVNAFLPESIVVNWAQLVSDEFNARYCAHERTYIYALQAGPCRSPMMRDHAGYLMLPADRWFDIDAMKLAAECLIGEHDFTSFRSSECQSKTPIKTLYSIEIFSQAPWLYFRIKGNAFLHHMVRNLVGSFLQIGVRKQSAKWMSEVLEAKDRSIAAPTFSAAGLYLVQISYPDEFRIPNPLLENAWLPPFLTVDLHKDTKK